MILPLRGLLPAHCILLALALLSCRPVASRDAPPAKVAPPSVAAPAASTTLRYPTAHKGNTVETLHGVQVSDPYRWLEDTDSEQTRRWIAEQNELTGAFLEHIPSRAAIKQRLTELWNYERFEIPIERGGRYFYLHNSGLQNQPVLHWLPALSGEPRLLFDANLLDAQGTVALKDFVPSEDGKLVAYAISQGGSDWHEWRVRRVDDGQDLPDLIRWSKFSSISWLPDGSGFFYNRYDEPQAGAALEATNYYNKLYFHRLGQEQALDQLVYERRDEKEWSFHPTVTEDGRYLVITVGKGTDPKHCVLYKDLRQPKGAVRELLMGFTGEYSFVGSKDTRLWFVTDRDAPRRRLVALDLNDPKRTLHPVIQQREETLEAVARVGGKFMANYLKDAHAELRVFTNDGQLERTLTLPALGSVGGPVGRERSSEVFFSFESFAWPRSIHRYDVARGSQSVFRSPQVGFAASAFTIKQVFYRSKDGTRIPMFLAHKQGLVPSRDTPCLLYGYGGFAISITPSFRPENLAWLELGGLLAIPNLRGGGEYGKDWHEAGKGAQKQNVFDDFIAAAEYLIAEGFTAPSKLAIQGRSNGGLLVGAMITQRPELFAAALPGVGVLDMLRFHKFTIGWAWVDDYGSPDDAADFQALLAYSPLHNLKPGGHYPATLITTADHDDRVVPAHSFKFAAALQAAQAGPAPILIRIETRAGHGAGKATAQRIEEFADQWAFLQDRLGMNPAP